jgi:hypothetical protein
VELFLLQETQNQQNERVYCFVEQYSTKKFNC